MVPSVTGIIRAAGLMPTWNTSDWYMERGKAVHAAVEYYEQGDLDQTNMDPVIHPYLKAWRRFRVDTAYTSLTRELIIHHPIYQFCGTLDQTGIVNGKTCVIDLKTGSYQPWWGLQTAAYNSIAKCTKRYSVELREDATYALTEHNGKQDFKMFLACLTVTNMKAKYGIK